MVLAIKKSDVGAMTMEGSKHRLVNDDDLVIRKANKSDVDYIIHLCWKCLPERRFIEGPMTRARQWWRSLVDVEFSELWIVEYKDRRVGFCKLEKDLIAFRSHREEFAPTLCDRIITVVVNPRVALYKLKVRCCGWRRRQETSVTKAPLPVDSIVWLRPILVEPCNARPRYRLGNYTICDQPGQNPWPKGREAPGRA